MRNIHRGLGRRARAQPRAPPEDGEEQRLRHPKGEKRQEAEGGLLLLIRARDRRYRDIPGREEGKAEGRRKEEDPEGKNCGRAAGRDATRSRTAEARKAEKNPHSGRKDCKDNCSCSAWKRKEDDTAGSAEGSQGHRTKRNPLPHRRFTRTTQDAGGEQSAEHGDRKECNRLQGCDRDRLQPA